MDARQEKGRELADRGRVVRDGEGRWLVFSMTSTNKYSVTLHPPTCTCPDFELRQAPCKHVLAVRSAIAQERSDKLLGKPPREPVGGAPLQRPRKTYKQVWPAYDAAQRNEKAEFLVLLADLCRGIVEPERKVGRGRPPAPLAAQAFAACFKVWTGLSGRRFTTDLREAQAKGHVSEAISHSGIARFFEDEGSFTILRNMVSVSALPWAALESEFAVDSSGFSACKFDRWFDAKYGRMHAEHAWVKAHIMTGTLTNCITAVEIKEKEANDAPQLPPLVEATTMGFKIKEVSGDKAYGTVENYDSIDKAGATPYIAFRISSTGWSGGLWEKMYHKFCLEKEDFLRHYHRRSNVESTFSAVKRKFGDSVRSKTDPAMKNEVLAKLVCHNIACVIHSGYEFGIDADCATDDEPDSKMILKFPI